MSISRSKLPITTQLLLLLLVVFAVNGAAYFVILHNVYLHELKAQARTVVANVEAFSEWVARSEQLWVKDGSQDYLSDEEVIPVNRPEERIHFYSKNPALATREYSEVIAASKSEAKFRLTSENAMNPSNAPDAFELRALAALKLNHAKEYYEADGAMYRFASPIYHHMTCIQCHGDPATAPSEILRVYGKENGFGFKAGDLAGVISVSLPKKKLLASSAIRYSLAILGMIFLSIVPVIWFVHSTIIKPVRKLTRVAEKISIGEDTDRDIETTPEGSGNEIHQLQQATGRMRNSFTITLRKLKEARAQTDKAVRYAKQLQENTKPTGRPPEPPKS